jgi:thiamine-monophosphate kinase
MPGEAEIISRLKKLLPVSEDVLLGVGDDAAVVKTTSGRDLIVCCDLLVEGVHFRTDWTPARLLGWKALAVTLSDVAAMGGVPKFAMVSIALPHWCSTDFIDELFEGMSELAESCGVAIIGGDTSSSRDSLFIDVSVIGDCQSGKAITRRGANIGDRIYVSGSLGASAFGLSLLEEGFRLDGSQGVGDLRSQAVLKHLSPGPQLKLGRALGETGLATAMIDISDGLSTDLHHILDESRVGAVIRAGAIPIAESVRSTAPGTPETDRLSLAIHSGEEYELLFTARPENHQRLISLAEGNNVNVTAIGDIIAGTELHLERNGANELVQPLGYQHLI